jgi:hypothetical protein
MRKERMHTEKSRVLLSNCKTTKCQVLKLYSNPAANLHLYQTSENWLIYRQTQRERERERGGGNKFLSKPQNVPMRRSEF